MVAPLPPPYSSLLFPISLYPSLPLPFPSCPPLCPSPFPSVTLSAPPPCPLHILCFLSIPFSNSLYFCSLPHSSSSLFPTCPSPSSLLLQCMHPGLCRLSASDATTSYSSPVDSGSSDDLHSHVMDHRPKDSDVGVPLETSVTVFCDKDVRTVNINELLEVSIIKKWLLTHETGNMVHKLLHSSKYFLSDTLTL